MINRTFDNYKHRQVPYPEQRYYSVQKKTVCRCTFLGSFSVLHLNFSSFLHHIDALSCTMHSEFQTFLIYQPSQLITSATLFCSETQRNPMLQNKKVTWFFLLTKHKQFFTIQSFKKFSLTWVGHQMRDVKSFHSK